MTPPEPDRVPHVESGRQRRQKAPMSSRQRILVWGVVLFLGAVVVLLVSPVFDQTAERGKSTKSLARAKQLALCSKFYASDYNGAFPPGTHRESARAVSAKSSDEVFTVLIQGGYLPDETLLHVDGSAWSNRAPDSDKVVEPGENHWAYFAGLVDTDPAEWPLIAAAWMPGTQAHYTKDRKLRGHVSDTGKVPVIRLDISGHLEEPSGKNLEVIVDSSAPAPPQWLVLSGPKAGKRNILVPDPATGWLKHATPLLPAQ